MGGARWRHATFEPLGTAKRYLGQFVIEATEKSPLASRLGRTVKTGFNVAGWGAIELGKPVIKNFPHVIITSDRARATEHNPNNSTPSPTGGCHQIESR